MILPSPPSVSRFENSRCTAFAGDAGHQGPSCSGGTGPVHDRIARRQPTSIRLQNSDFMMYMMAVPQRRCESTCRRMMSRRIAVLSREKAASVKLLQGGTGLVRAGPLAQTVLQTVPWRIPHRFADQPRRYMARFSPCPTHCSPPAVATTSTATATATSG